VRETVIISYRGATYEIGRGQHFYAIWPSGTSQLPPQELWPATPEGWTTAWARFLQLESPDTIVAVGRSGPQTALSRRSSIIAAVTLGIGVTFGIAGLFPAYFTGASLAQSAADLAPHVIYLAGWTASAVLIALGGSRVRTGALLGIGTSVVTFGLFLADGGTAISAGADIAGAGLVLSLIGWAACAAGSVLALRRLSADGVGRPRARGHQAATVVTLILAGLGAVIAFAPSWDRYTLRTSGGFAESLTAGNAFANPGLVITGDVAVMLAVAAVVVIAAVWRPSRQGAALLAGAIIPLLGQAISAFIAVGQPAAPEQFGFSASQAASIGLTISSGLTLAFWVYCAFIVAMLLSCALMITAPDPFAPAASRAQSAGTSTATGFEPAPMQPVVTGFPEVSAGA
jgi:hypothetical protein